ncbi:hypothetical protein [Thiolapillus sp.]
MPGCFLVAVKHGATGWSPRRVRNTNRPPTTGRATTVNKTDALKGVAVIVWSVHWLWTDRRPVVQPTAAQGQRVTGNGFV